MQTLSQVSSCKWLFLRELNDGPDNALRILVEEGRTQDAVQNIEVAGIEISGVRAIEHDGSCRVFELTWGNYVCYAARNESYAQGDEKEWKGQRVRRHESSRFLGYVAEDTFASAHYPGPFGHIEIVCEHHVIDVASMDEPTVKLLQGGKPRAVSSPNTSRERTRER
jgi:hypothetical protein